MQSPLQTKKGLLEHVLESATALGMNLSIIAVSWEDISNYHWQQDRISSWTPFLWPE